MIAFGLTSCLDYELEWDSESIRTMYEHIKENFEYTGKITTISSVSDFLNNLIYYINNGSGAEIVISNSDILKNILSYFSYKISLGGTATRAAIELSKINISSILHVSSNNSEIKKQIKNNCKITPYYASNNLEAHPHAIIQYPSNASLEFIPYYKKTNNSNRLICVYDPASEVLQLNYEFFKRIQKSTEKTKLVISGFNAIHTEHNLELAMDEVQNALESLELHEVTVFYEDAGFHFENFKFKILAKFAQLIDVYSMNENEFQNLLNDKPNLTDPKSVYKSLCVIAQKYNLKNIVVHTQWYALYYGEVDSSIHYALENGINLAATRYMYGDQFGINEFNLVSSLPKCDIGIKFSKLINKNKRIISVPSVDIKVSRPTTVGLGDTFVGGFQLDKKL